MKLFSESHFNYYAKPKVASQKDIDWCDHYDMRIRFSDINCNGFQGHLLDILYRTVRTLIQIKLL